MPLQLPRWGHNGAKPFMGSTFPQRHDIKVQVNWKLTKGKYIHQVPAMCSVVQSVVSLTSSLVVKMLTALVSTKSNSQEFLVKKCE